VAAERAESERLRQDALKFSASQQAKADFDRTAPTVQLEGLVLHGGSFNGAYKAVFGGQTSSGQPVFRHSSGARFYYCNGSGQDCSKPDRWHLEHPTTGRSLMFGCQQDSSSPADVNSWMYSDGNWQPFHGLVNCATGLHAPGCGNARPSSSSQPSTRACTSIALECALLKWKPLLAQFVHSRDNLV